MDELFLLKPGFTDPAAGPGQYYCPHCAAFVGILNYYPHLRTALNVHEVDFPRPRAAVAALLGPQHPGCPVLVLDEGRPDPFGIKIEVAPTGRRYIAEDAGIRKYLAYAYDVDSPHP
jgi:hypothetical protein